MQGHMKEGTEEKDTGFPLTTGGNDRRGRAGMTEGEGGNDRWGRVFLGSNVPSPRPSPQGNPLL